MSGAPESGSGEGGFRARAGALTLLYLASPMDRSVLLALLAELATGAQVVEEVEVPDPEEPVPLEIIADPYLVEPADPEHDPNEPIGWDTMLRPSRAGRELLFVGSVLERWLRECPDGPLELGPEAGPALSALLGGWASTAMHVLAARPLTVAEVTEEIGILAYDFVEERIEAMESVGLVEVLSRDEDEDRYGEEEERRFAVTEWLRTSIAPLTAAARQELRHPLEDTAPIAALDIQAALLLTLPLLRLPEGLAGNCSLAVDLEEGVPGSPAGVTARVERGRIASCGVHLDEEVDAWTAAPAVDWLDTVIDHDTRRVRCGGERGLARRVLHELHETLFGVR